MGDFGEAQNALNQLLGIIATVRGIEEQLGQRPIDRIERETEELGAAIDRDSVAQQRALQIQGILSGQAIAPNYDTGHITAPSGVPQGWQDQLPVPQIYSPAPQDQNYGVFTFHGDGTGNYPPSENARAYQRLLNGLFGSNLAEDGRFGRSTLTESQRLSSFMRPFNPNFDPALITNDDIRILNENQAALQAFALNERNRYAAPDVARPSVTIGGDDAGLRSISEQVAFFANDTQYEGHFVADSYNNVFFQTNAGEKIAIGHTDAATFIRGSDHYLLASISGSGDVMIVESNQYGDIGRSVLQLTPEIRTGALEVVPTENRFAAADVAAHGAPPAVGQTLEAVRALT